jgi:hypothetical protein
MIVPNWSVWAALAVNVVRHVVSNAFLSASIGRSEPEARAFCAREGREAMRLPGFNAETSLYKTSVHYRLMGALVHGDGVMLQQLRLPGQPLTVSCGPCSPDNTGACTQSCTFCVGNSCVPFTQQCSAVDQMNCCNMQCGAKRGCARGQCYCECFGGTWGPDPLYGPPCYAGCGF